MVSLKGAPDAARLSLSLMNLVSLGYEMKWMGTVTIDG